MYRGNILNKTVHLPYGHQIGRTIRSYNTRGVQSVIQAPTVHCLLYFYFYSQTYWKERRHQI